MSPTRSRVLPLSHLEPLEPRALLANSVSFVDVDGDAVTVKVTGPGTAIPTLSAGASGFITFLTLNGTTGASSLSISVKQAGAGDAQVVLEDMTDGASLKSFKAPTTSWLTNPDIIVNEIQSFTLGTWGVDIDFLRLVTPIGKSLAITLESLGGSMQVVGDVSSFKAGSSNDESDVSIDGVLTNVRLTDFMGGSWIADSFGSVTVVGTLEADLQARGPNALGYSFGAIRANGAFLANVRTAAGGTDGRIKSLIIANSWTGLDGITASGIDTLRVSGFFSPGTLNLSASGLGEFAIKNGTITGQADGEWNLAAEIKSLKIGGTLSGLVVGSSGNNVHIGSLAFTGDDPIGGEWEVRSIRTLTSKSELGGEWGNFRVAPGTTTSIGTLTAPRIVDMTLESSFGGIDSLTTNHMESSSLRAEYFKTVTIKKGGGAAGGNGDFIATNLRARSQNAQGFSITTLTVAGLSDDSTIMTRFDAKTLSFGRFLDTVLFVGHVDPFNGGAPVFGDVSGLDGTRTIGSLTIGKAFDPLVTVLGNGVRITTGHLNKLTVKGFTNPDNGNSLHGFVALSYGTMTFKNADGLNAEVSGAALPVGDTLFLPPETDMVIRVVV